MQAVIKQAIFPAIIAFNTTSVKSPFLEGAIAPNPPRVIPIEERLANPHKAYVDITTDLPLNKNCGI